MVLGVIVVPQYLICCGTLEVTQAEAQVPVDAVHGGALGEQACLTSSLCFKAQASQKLTFIPSVLHTSFSTNCVPGIVPGQCKKWPGDCLLLGVHREHCLMPPTVRMQGALQG